MRLSPRMESPQLEHRKCLSCLGLIAATDPNIYCFKCHGPDHSSDSIKKPQPCVKCRALSSVSIGTTFTAHTSSWSATRARQKQPLMKIISTLSFALFNCRLSHRQQWRFCHQMKTTASPRCLLPQLPIRLDHCGWSCWVNNAPTW